MFKIVERILGPLKTCYFLYSEGFYLKETEDELCLYKKERKEKIPIRKGALVSQYRQIRDFAKSFDYILSNNVEFTKDSILIKDLNGVAFQIKREKSDLHTLMALCFYFEDKTGKCLQKPAAEFLGYIRKTDVKKNDIVIDAGAFHGWFAIYAAKKAEAGHVYCFEPDKQNINMLKENIELNNLKNITIVEEVLAGKTGFVNFFETGDVASRIIESLANSGPNNTIKRLPSISLADFCSREKIKKVDFLKMDVEGAECDILSRSKEFIKNNVEYLAIASYHPISDKDKGLTSTLLEPMLKDMGFRVETNYPTHQTTYGWKT
jgi:FkbM family methyltransferase